MATLRQGAVAASGGPPGGARRTDGKAASDREAVDGINGVLGNGRGAERGWSLRWAGGPEEPRPTQPQM